MDELEDVVVDSARRGTLPSDASEALDGGADSVVLDGLSGSGVGDGGVWFVSPTVPATGVDETSVPEPATAELGGVETSVCCCEVGDGVGAGVGPGVDAGVLEGISAKDTGAEDTDVEGPGAKTGAVELAAGVEKGI